MTTMAYEGWAICEQMGFKKCIAKISEIEQYGAKMLRMDLPVFDADGKITDWVTEFAGGPSIYNITPISEEVGIDAARRQADPRPVRPVDYRLEHKPEPFRDGAVGVEIPIDDDEEELAF
jgi:hypothetical protein